MTKNEKRHNKVIMTPEAVALREIRLDKGLSIRETCKALNKPKSFTKPFTPTFVTIPSPKNQTNEPLIGQMWSLCSAIFLVALS